MSAKDKLIYSLMKEISSLISPEKASDVFYEIGRRLAKDIGSPDEAISFLQKEGFGRFEIEKITPKTFRIKAYDAPLPKLAWEEGYGMPFCDLVRGVIAASCEAFTGVPYVVEEVKCCAAGHPYCEFFAKPSTAPVVAPTLMTELKVPGERVAEIAQLWPLLELLSKGPLDAPSIAEKLGVSLEKAQELIAKAEDAGITAVTKEGKIALRVGKIVSQFPEWHESLGVPVWDDRARFELVTSALPFDYVISSFRAFLRLDEKRGCHYTYYIEVLNASEGPLAEVEFWTGPPVLFGTREMIGLSAYDAEGRLPIEIINPEEGLVRVRFRYPIPPGAKYAFNIAFYRTISATETITAAGKVNCFICYFKSDVPCGKADISIVLPENYEPVESRVLGYLDPARKRPIGAFSEEVYGESYYLTYRRDFMDLGVCYEFSVDYRKKVKA